MKILYVFASPALKGSSVQTKVVNQIKYLNQIGIQCNGAFFSSEVTEVTPINSQINLISVAKNSKKYFQATQYRKNVDYSLQKYISVVECNYDVIYIRYPLASKSFCKITKQYGKKIIIEHQSKEIHEIISLLKNKPFQFKLGYFLHVLEFGLLKIATEYFYGKCVLKNIAGGIAVTSEIAEYEKSRINAKYNCLVVGNGLIVEDYKLTEQALFTNNVLKCFVLIGANTSSPTHGVDRLIKSVKKNNSKYFIELSVFSKQEKKILEGANYKITFEGYLTKEELNTKLNQMHFAFGGLASFRKGILFGSGLKVREYFARGFPIIMASFDEDIEKSSEAKQFVIQVPNCEDLIDFKVLEPKIDSILIKSDRTMQIRDLSVNLFSIEAKMKQLIDSITSIMNN